MRPALVAATVLSVCLLGCHSAYIEAMVVNHTKSPLALVEVDYPSASFGTQDLAPGASYQYRFKVLGEGATKALWTDATHTDHTLNGPELRENDEGRLVLTFEPAGPAWTKALTNRGHAR